MSIPCSLETSQSWINSVEQDSYAKVDLKISITGHKITHRFSPTLRTDQPNPSVGFDQQLSPLILENAGSQLPLNTTTTSRILLLKIQNCDLFTHLEINYGLLSGIWLANKVYKSIFVLHLHNNQFHPRFRITKRRKSRDTTISMFVRYTAQHSKPHSAWFTYQVYHQVLSTPNFWQEIVLLRKKHAALMIVSLEVKQLIVFYVKDVLYIEVL